MDIDIRVGMKQSEINGLFNEIEEQKRQRTHLNDGIKLKTEKIIDHIAKHGNVLAYKNNEAHVLTIKKGMSRKFNKGQLATDLGCTQSDLDVVGISSYVERGSLTTGQLEKYFYEEETESLKARKAKKSDIELLTGGGRG